MSIVLDRSAPTRTPVALLMFNRPDLTAQVFEAIRAARPSRLLVVCDGARNDAERERVAATRAVIQVDWPCEVETNYSDVNLGCKRRVASGLDWVFERCEEAIVLEDDCLPSRSFFPYCDALLEHYRSDPRVMCISGMNLYQGNGNAVRGDETYHLVRYGHTNGWASWRRAWKFFDVELSSWPADRAAGRLRDVFPTQAERWFWTALLDRQHAGLINTWDYQWYYARWIHGGLTAIPVRNMVINLGFRDDATHATEMSSAWNAARSHHELDELRHPRYIVPNWDVDRHYFDKITNPLGLPGIAMSSARRFYNRLRGRELR